MSIVNISSHPAFGMTPGAIDPHELGWQEVKDLGLEPEPPGMTPDDDDADQQ